MNIYIYNSGIIDKFIFRKCIWWMWLNIMNLVSFSEYHRTFRFPSLFRTTFNTSKNIKHLRRPSKKKKRKKMWPSNDSMLSWKQFRRGRIFSLTIELVSHVQLIFLPICLSCLFKIHCIYPTDFYLFKINNENTRNPFEVWNLFKISKSNTRATSVTSFWCLYC